MIEYGKLKFGVCVCIALLVGVSSVLVADENNEKAGRKKVIENSMGMKLVSLPAGEFEMGLISREALEANHQFSIRTRGGDDPSMRVKLTRPFAIGMTEVTVGQFKAFVEATDYKTDAERNKGAFVYHDKVEDETERFAREPGTSWRNPGFPQEDNHPVTCVSWHDAMAFCKWLSEKEKAVYRLPTEAEWEYACRSGTRTVYFCGDKPDDVYAYANVADAALYAKHPHIVIRQRVLALKPGQGDGFVYTAGVGSLKPGPWGIHDMHGNVWEWCSDKYQGDYYKMRRDAYMKKHDVRRDKVVITDPAGPADTPKHKYGDWRSIRGGSWYVSPYTCRSSIRAYAEAHDPYSYIGFRVVKEMPAE